MTCDKNKVIEIALAEVGYLEKASNSDLDSMTGNAGNNNWTKYARDLYAAGYYNGNKNGYSWCDIWVDWVFWMACGKDKKAAEEAECQTGTLGAGCIYSAQYYRNAGRFYNSPQIGDQIFFGAKGNEEHTGIVYAVDNNVVYTVEGNTSSAEGVVANGGTVAKKSYSLGYSWISGYGRPKYDTSASKTTVAKQSAPVTINSIIDVQKYLNAEHGANLDVDGVYGKNTKAILVKAIQKQIGATADGNFGSQSKAKWRTLQKGSKGTLVKLVQCGLICNKCPITFGADGDFGNYTFEAVKKFQKAKWLTVDGIFGPATAYKMFH